MMTRWLLTCLFAWLCIGAHPFVCELPVAAQDPNQLHNDEKGTAFFESRIRPVLREQCVGCHNVQKRSGSLTLDHRTGWAEGGDSGVVIVPGKPEQSLLLEVIRHSVPGMEMPAKAPKLDDRTIADFAEWIRLGAPDPRTEPETLASENARPWNELRDERAQWWSFQPLAKHDGPSNPMSTSIDTLIDREMRNTGLQSAAPANRRTLIRRLSYTLRGLPPTPAESEMFPGDESPDAWERCVDRMLDAPTFGERWARHWMDVVRYADTHGSEDDAYLPFAYRYRDYLVRAFNADVPFDQLIREQIAGDLVPARWNHDLEFNESIIGTAFWRFVEFNQTPVDVKREEIVVMDSQIDALGKAFQALTISCARCHDHKFDPISDEDFYALYGILRSTRAGMRIIDSPEKFTKQNNELRETGLQLKSELASEWSRQINEWPDQIRNATAWLTTNAPKDAKPADVEAKLLADVWVRALWSAKHKPEQHPLGPVFELLQADDETIPSVWADAVARNHAVQSVSDSGPLPDGAHELFDLRDGLHGWRPVGAGLPDDSRHQSGGFAIDAGSKQLVSAILERGYHSNVLSDRHAGVIRSPDFVVDGEMLSVLARGTHQARVRLVIENFQGDSLLFATVNPELNSNSLRWYGMTIRPQWRGLRAHIELMTRDDKPYVGVIKDPERFEASNGRSSFGVARVVMHSRSITMPNPPTLPESLWTKDIDSANNLVAAIVNATRQTLDRWQTNQCSDNDARWLSFLMETDLLKVRQSQNRRMSALVQKYLEVEQRIPIARRSPGVFEDHCAIDQEFLPRGNHKQPEENVARRYLEILGGAPFGDSFADAGRLQLADAIANPGNPLTARVYVNRVWHWMFGRGLVSTVDNFGRMGESPTHPELLDELARQFIESGWSTKSLIRAIAVSHVWQRDSIRHASAGEADPGNRLWSHTLMRPLDAESIRDTMLAVSGKMREFDSGLGTRVFYRSVFDEKKQPPPGPLDGDHRRSLFLEVRRNFPNEFLIAFDFPKPSAPTGRRSQTTVPAQSLVLLNDPFPIHCAQHWAARVSAEHATSRDRIRQYYVELLAREPTEDEFLQAERFVAAAAAGSTEADAWASLAHAMFNLKEAIFLR